MITVFYVTASEPKEAAAAEREAKQSGFEMRAVRRHDLAKFFQAQDAEKHVADMGDAGWAHVRVETRQEREEDQHPAHQGTFDVRRGPNGVTSSVQTAPAAWEHIAPDVE